MSAAGAVHRGHRPQSVTLYTDHRKLNFVPSIQLSIGIKVMRNRSLSHQGDTIRRLGEFGVSHAHLPGEPEFLEELPIPRRQLYLKRRLTVPESPGGPLLTN